MNVIAKVQFSNNQVAIRLFKNCKPALIDDIKEAYAAGSKIAVNDKIMTIVKLDLNIECHCNQCCEKLAPLEYIDQFGGWWSLCNDCEDKGYYLYHSCGDVEVRFDNVVVVGWCK